MPHGPPARRTANRPRPRSAAAPTGEQRVRHTGLFGQTWLTCELAATDAEPTALRDPHRPLVRRGRERAEHRALSRASCGGPRLHGHTSTTSLPSPDTFLWPDRRPGHSLPRCGVIGAPHLLKGSRHDKTTVGRRARRRRGRGGEHDAGADHGHDGGDQPRAFDQGRPSARQRPRPPARPVRATVAQAAGRRAAHQPGGPRRSATPRAGCWSSSLPRPTSTGRPSASRPRRSGLDGPGRRRRGRHARGLRPARAVARARGAAAAPARSPRRSSRTTHIGTATSQGVALQRADKVPGQGRRRQGHHHRRAVGLLRRRHDDLHGGPLTIHARPRTSRPATCPARATAQPQAGRGARGLPDDDRRHRRGPRRCCRSPTTSPRAASSASPPPFSGQIGFADNIRRLADKKGQCGADVVVDDVELLRRADVLRRHRSPTPSTTWPPRASTTSPPPATTARSSRGTPRSRLIPAKQGVKGTNLDFSDVDPALYDGGLQDMNPGTGTDVAQDVARSATAAA